MDLAVNLPPTSEGYNHVLIVVDAFSKWVEVIPLKTKTSAEVARRFLHNVVSRYGAPIAVRSDKGGEFRGDFDKLLWTLGSRHYETTPGNPQSNGLVERMV